MCSRRVTRTSGAKRTLSMSNLLLQWEDSGTASRGWKGKFHIFSQTFSVFFNSHDFFHCQHQKIQIPILGSKMAFSCCNESHVSFSIHHYFLQFDVCHLTLSLSLAPIFACTNLLVHCAFMTKARGDVINFLKHRAQN